MHLGTLAIPMAEYPIVAALLHTGTANLRIPFFYEVTVGEQTYEEEYPPQEELHR